MNINLTLLFQVAFFAVFVWFCKQYVWPPIISALSARKTTIADGLAAAEKGQLAEQAGREKANEIIADAKSQASEIVARAETQGSQLLNDAKTAARDEGARIVAAARSEIDTEVGKAKEVLRAQVGALAVAGARQILKRELDEKSHADLLKRIADKF